MSKYQHCINVIHFEDLLENLRIKTCCALHNPRVKSSRNRNIRLVCALKDLKAFEAWISWILDISNTSCSESLFFTQNISDMSVSLMIKKSLLRTISMTSLPQFMNFLGDCYSILMEGSLYCYRIPDETQLIASESVCYHHSDEYSFSHAVLHAQSCDRAIHIHNS